MIKRLTMFLMSILVVLALAGEARGEEMNIVWFADLYVGMTAAQESTIKITGEPTATSSSVRNKVDSSQSFAGGGRIGIRFPIEKFLLESLEIGPDVYAFNPANEIHAVTALSPLILTFRGPGKTIKPYIGVGLTILFTKIRFDFDGISDTKKARGPAMSVPVGIELWSKFFLEYRFLWGSLEAGGIWRNGILRGLPVALLVDDKTNFTAHTVVVGYRF